MNWTSFLTGAGVGSAGLFVVSYVFLLLTAHKPSAPVPHPLADDIKLMRQHMGNLAQAVQISGSLLHALALVVPEARPLLVPAEAAVPVAEEVVHSLMQQSEG